MIRHGEADSKLTNETESQQYPSLTKSLTRKLRLLRIYHTGTIIGNPKLCCDVASDKLSDMMVRGQERGTELLRISQGRITGGHVKGVRTPHSAFRPLRLSNRKFSLTNPLSVRNATPLATHSCAFPPPIFPRIFVHEPYICHGHRDRSPGESWPGAEKIAWEVSMREAT